jgi:Cu2+-exporting ATPase
MVWYSSGDDLGPATRQLIYWISALVGIPAALISSRVFFRSAWQSLSRGQANMDLPISLSILLALALSLYLTIINGRHIYFDAAVMLPFLLLIGRYLDHRVRYEARSAARDLLAMQTLTGTRLTGAGATETVAPRDIAIGDRLLLRTGDRAPVDGTIETATDADLSLVTGETLPAKLAAGTALYAGSVVTGPAAVLRVTARVENSLVAEISRLLEAGQQNRSSYVRLADRAARIYVPAVFAATLCVFGWWLIVLHAPFPVALENAIALLIITCPCALGIAVPAVQVVASGTLFRRGVLVKSGDALERLSGIDWVVFDKTGTLTLGSPQLMNAGEIAPQAIEAAARLARTSRHPLARALAAFAGDGPVAVGAVEVRGCGIEVSDRGETRRLGSAAWVGAASHDAARPELWFRIGEAPPVRFVFEDALRSDAKEALSALARRNLPVEILSGDSEIAVAHAARESGVGAWRARMTPAEKAARVQALHDAGHRVLVVGDGLNDAAALALAHVAMSPGSAIDATQTGADIVLQNDRLALIDETIAMARRVRRRVNENFAFAAAYNCIAIPIAAAGLVTPIVASVAMAASSLIVTLNALRLSRTEA